MASVVDEIQPVYGIVAEVRCGSAAKATNALTGQQYGVEQTDGFCRIRFDCIDIHETVMIEF